MLRCVGSTCARGVHRRRDDTEMIPSVRLCSRAPRRSLSSSPVPLHGAQGRHCLGSTRCRCWADTRRGGRARCWAGASAAGTALPLPERSRGEAEGRARCEGNAGAGAVAAPPWRGRWRGRCCLRDTCLTPGRGWGGALGRVPGRPGCMTGQGQTERAGGPAVVPAHSLPLGTPTAGRTHRSLHASTYRRVAIAGTCATQGANAGTRARS